MTHRIRIALTTVTLLTLALGLTSCADNTQPSRTAPTVTPSADMNATAANGDLLIEDPRPADSDWQPWEDEVDSYFQTEPPTQLRQIALADQPKGSGPQIALRFLRALQRHDDLAADRELFIYGRQLLAQRDLGVLRTVMNDIRRNAGLEQAGPCTGAQPLNQASAIVTCGARQVVVHVLSGEASGVQIGDWHTHGDVYRGPHSHAYTTLEL